jgi:ribosomal protein S19E (S16A)
MFPLSWTDVQLQRACNIYHDLLKSITIMLAGAWDGTKSLRAMHHERRPGSRDWWYLNGRVASLRCSLSLPCVVHQRHHRAH